MKRKVKLEMEETDELFEPKEEWTFHDNSFTGGIMDGFDAVLKLIPWLIVAGLIFLLVC